jgi:hypothetical protein
LEEDGKDQLERNEDVLKRVGERRSMKDTIWKRKARWLGHIMRSEGMMRTVMEGRAEGKRGRGRRRLAMLDDVREGREYHIVKEMALNRHRWRTMVHAGPAQGQTT